jgi:hypothetical protein
VYPGFVALAIPEKQHRQHKAIAPKNANNDFFTIKSPFSRSSLKFV